MSDPIKWKDMTPEQKGALLLAHHEGKVIERYRSGMWEVVEEPVWTYYATYRVKPEPVVEVVTMYFPFNDPLNMSFEQTPHDTHSITYNKKDGKPDCDSIKMESIND